MDQEKDEVRRLLEILRTLMRMLAFSNREVERRMGLNHSTLSRVFGGIVEAKLELVLGVARAIGLEYDEFFAFAYPERRAGAAESPAARKIRSMLEDLQPAGFSAPARPEEPAAAVRRAPFAESLNRDELMADLKQTVREIMGEMGAASGGGSKAGNGGE
jgi:transcriptional regulator with XRE-family HTH domain